MLDNEEIRFMRYFIFVVFILVLIVVSRIAMADSFIVTSNSFNEGDMMKNIYACPENRQFHLLWKGFPDNTKSFAIIMDDPEAVSVAGFTWVHWNVFGNSSSITFIEEGQHNIAGSTTGMSHFNEKNYLGPCPPPDQVHTYVICVYALSEELDNSIARKPITRATFENQYDSTILAKAEITSQYKR